MIDEIERTLADSVGQVLDPEHRIVLGSCFPIAHEGVVVTCFHVIGENSTGKVSRPMVCINWPQLNIDAIAYVDIASSRPTSDIAILNLDGRKIPEGVSVLTLELRLFPNSRFVSFGYRKADSYKGLFSRGAIHGEVMESSGHSLIQMTTSDMGRGMSGAPIVYEDYHRVVGVASSYWQSKEPQDRDLAFAIPASEIVRCLPRLTASIPGMVAIPREHSTGRPKAGYSTSSGPLEPFKNVIRNAFVNAAILILADQFSDGSWARTLWRWSGGPFTKDVAPQDVVDKTKVKKALTVTSWAGQAIFKATGNNRLSCLMNARTYIKSHWNVQAKAFGFLYDQHIGTPFIESNSMFVGNPRHTASAAKFLEMTDGISAQVIDSVQFILRCESEERGGWGEREGARPNSLSTAYILDALLKIAQAPGLVACLPSDASSKLYPSITRGLAWLAQNQESATGLWDYENHPDLRPFYTAHVLAFAPQMVSVFPHEVENAIRGLLAQKRKGGIPTHMRGEPRIAATAMLAYGLSKIDPIRYEEEIVSLCTFTTTEFAKSEYLAQYHIFDSIFLLLLSQLPFINSSWWLSDLNEVIKEVEEILSGPSDWNEARQGIEAVGVTYGVNNSMALSIISESPRYA